MLNLQFIRDNPEAVRAGLAAKGADAPIDQILALDVEWRNAQAELQEQQTRRNGIQATMNAANKAKDAAARQAAIEQMKPCSARIKELEPRVDDLRAALDELLPQVPNLPHG